MMIRKILFFTLFFGVVFCQEHFEQILNATLEYNFGSLYGGCVTIDGDMIAVSSINRVHIFENIETNWEEVQIIESPIPFVNFGKTIHFSGSKLFISAHYDGNGNIYISKRKWSVGAG